MKREEISLEYIYDLAFSIANQLDWRDYQVTLFREGTVDFSSVIGVIEYNPNGEGGVGGGVTTILNDGRKIVELYAEGIKGIIMAIMDFYGKESIKPEGVKALVDICIKHEYRHSCQYDWLLDHGISLFQVSQDELKYPYSKGPLESDAIAFSQGKPVPEFDELFATKEYDDLAAKYRNELAEAIDICKYFIF